MKIALSLAAVIIVLWLAFGAIILWQFGWTGQGTFGDTFGVLNALFSGLAIGGVIVAVIMQKQELAYQREELKLTRKELAKTTEAQQASAHALTQQVEVAALTAELNAVVAIATVDWRGVRGADFTVGDVKLQIPELLKTIRTRREELERGLRGPERRG